MSTNWKLVLLGALALLGTLAAVAWRSYSAPPRHQLREGNDLAHAELSQNTTPEPEWVMKHNGFITALAWAPDSKTLATAASDDNVKLVDAATGKTLATLEHKATVQSVRFSPDSKVLATGDTTGLFRLWKPTAPGELLKGLRLEGRINSIDWSSDPNSVASGGGEFGLKGELVLWDLKTGKGKRLDTDGGEVACVAFSPDGKCLAEARRRTVHLWDTATCKESTTLKGHSAAVETIAFSPGGKSLASGSLDGTVKLWDWEHGKVTNTINVEAMSAYRELSPPGKKTSLWTAFSPNGKYLVWVCVTELTVWDLKAGKKIATLQKVPGPAVFSPDGRILATGCSDESVRAWSVEKLVNGSK